jgi:hypothetical protein
LPRVQGLLRQTAENRVEEQTILMASKPFG